MATNEEKIPDPSPEDKEEGKKWTDEQTLQFIALFEQYPCLYNTTLKEYHDRNERKKSFEEISKKIGFSEADIKAKMKSLRTTFGRERKKKKKKPPTGTGTDDVPPPSSWKFFESMRFIEDYIVPKKSISSIEQIDIDLSDVETEDKEQTVTSKDTKRKLPYKGLDSQKVKREKKETMLMDSVISYIGSRGPGTTKTEQTTDEYDVFGKYIANELRNVKDIKLQRWIKWSIQNTLYTAQCGGMNHGISYPPPFSPSSSVFTAMTPSPMGSINYIDGGDTP